MNRKADSACSERPFDVAGRGTALDDWLWG
jgi:hypothetical protein